MQLREATAFVMSLKGAALSCLFLMYAMREERRNWTRNDLADLTGWSRERVATGLHRLAVHELVLQQNSRAWQLTDMGYQLVLEKPGVSLNDSESHLKGLSHGSSSLKNHEELISHEDLKLPLLGVSLNDSQQIPDLIFENLIEQLIQCGSPPKTAREAISEAWRGNPNDQEIKRRILWWRCYCLSNNSMKFPGKLIAARVGEGVDTPIDFEPRDIPPRFSELREELEDFERQYQNQDE